MKKKYYVNKQRQITGEHEVHTEDCTFLPAEENRIYIGKFSHCRDALKAAREHFDNVDGCYYCSNECHSR